MVKKLFKKYSDYDIMLLPPMRDKVKVAAMEHFSELIVRSYSCGNMVVLLLCVLKQVRMSFKYGLCTATAEAFAAYGLILCGTFGDQEEGSRMGRLAKEVLVASREWDRVKAKNRECSVWCNTALFM